MRLDAAASRIPSPDRSEPTVAIIPIARRVAAEGVGTALLLTAIVGSGIMGERLAGGNTAVALLANSLATAGALVVLILVFGPVSGAHFNPVVTVAAAWRGELRWSTVPFYLVAQVFGAVTGVGVAHTMFDLPLFTLSAHIRSGATQAFSEAVATFGLLLVVFGCARQRPTAMPYAVACYIGAAYWFTASTSFANPAVTLARALTNSFSGIRPQDVASFIVAQCIGAAVAVFFVAWLMPARRVD